MSKNKKKDLRRAITEIENPFPKDDLILSYADFLKVRDYLKFYQFNPIVFYHLLALANEEWESAKRINRLSLIRTLKYYLYNGTPGSTEGYYEKISKAPDVIHPLETRVLIFDLFKKIFEKVQYISFRQIEEARDICNSLLFNIALTPDEEAWLCTHVSLDNVILNRVLRYPALSDTISKWAEKNYTCNDYRGRRAELLSWIIDKNPGFEIDIQTMVDDFEYLNRSDLKAIEQYEEELQAQKIIEKEFGDMLFTPPENEDYFSAYSSPFGRHSPELKLSGRFYPTPKDPSREVFLQIPDFKRLEEIFYDNLQKLQKITMIWAIGYSRLDNALKFPLLKKYYDRETYYSLYRVGKRTRNIELLTWLLNKEA